MAVTRIVSQDIKDGTIVNVDINASAAIDATKIADGSISNTEFQQLNNVGSAVVGISDTNTLTNKTITGATNVVAAGYLSTATPGSLVMVSGAAVPSSGQVLTAMGSGSAIWQAVSNALATSNFVFNEIPAGSVDGSNTQFKLANSVVSTGLLTVYKNGLRQTPGASADYTGFALTGLIFMAGNVPQVGDNILCDYIK